MLSPHGIPSDLLDRLLVVKTLPYTGDEILQIVQTRATTEVSMRQEFAGCSIACGPTRVRMALLFFSAAVQCCWPNFQLAIRPITGCALCPMAYALHVAKKNQREGFRKKRCTRAVP